MIYITGDTHRDFEDIHSFCAQHDTSKNDVMIILGDAGINFYKGWRDNNVKSYLESMPITFFCIHGNHEIRAYALDGYVIELWNAGSVYVEPAYPSIKFAKDGEIYDLAGKKTLVVGGAYSVDKNYRVARGWSWWEDEQPSESIKKQVEAAAEAHNWRIDVVQTHTCPLKYEPTEAFLPLIDQSEVDKSTEEWLDEIERKLEYKKWFCGHFHIDKTIDNIRFMFKDVIAFEDAFPEDVKEA